MIQTTEVWIISCDNCGVQYRKNFRSKFIALRYLSKHKWNVRSETMIKCADCMALEVV